MSNGKGRSFFNVGAGGSVIDVIFIVVAVIATAYYWYHSRGIAKIENARHEVVLTADAVRDTLDFEKTRIDSLRNVVRLTEARRDSIDGLIEQLKAQIPVEIERIQAAQEKSQQLTAEFLTLRGRLGAQQDRLRETRTEVENLTETEASLAGTETSFRDSVFAADQDRLALVRQVEDAIAYRERDPWSMFPVSASLAAYVEFAEDATFLDFSLAKDFYRTGRFDIGVTGMLGFGNEQGTSIKEAGLYANYELAFRKASIDLGVGVSSVRVGTDDDVTDPYVSLMLRYAPYYRERAFLLLGTKYSHESLSFLVGVGFGRR